MDFPMTINGEEVTNLKELRALAETSGPAQVILAEAFFHGDGVPQDFKKAHYYCEKAVENGESQGMLDLAFLYRKGIEVDIDYLKEEELNLRAAACGDEEAYGFLAETYLCGRGPVKQDLIKGLEYLYKAINSKYGDSHDDLLSLFGGKEQFLSIYSAIVEYNAVDEYILRRICSDLRTEQTEEEKKRIPEGLYDD